MASWNPTYLDAAVWSDPTDPSVFTFSGSSITAWRDKSGNGRDFKSTSTYKPWIAEGGINGLDCIQFNPTRSDWIQSNALINFPYITLFVVFVPETLTGYYDQMIVQNYGGVDAYYVAHGYSNLRCAFAATDGNVYVSSNGDLSRGLEPYIVCLRYSATTAESFCDGTLRATAAAKGALRDTNYGLVYGYDNSYNNAEFGGKLGDVILFSEAISDTDRQTVEGYLAHKWGIASVLPSDHPYKLIAPRPPASIGGIVRGADGEPASRVVRIYDRSTGALMTEVNSDATTGAYDIGLKSTGEVQRIVLADEPAFYNDIIDRVIPG